MSSPDQRASDALVVGGLSEKAAAGDTRTLVVLSGIVSITIAAVYWILRAGFENPSGPVLKSVALSLFLITFPLILRTTLLRTHPRDGAESWASSYAFLWLAGIGFTGLIGRLVPIVGLNPFFLF